MKEAETSTIIGKAPGRGTTAAAASLALISAMALWSGAAHAQSGPFVYVPNFDGGSVSSLDIPSGGLAPGAIGVGDGPYAVAVRGDQSLFYVSNNSDGTVSVVDIATNGAVATIAVDGPLGLAISPDGRLVYVTSGASNSISVIDTSSNTVTATIPVGAAPFDVAFSPDGTRAYVTNSLGNTVSVINTATNTVTATINVGNTPADVFVSPAGSLAYVTNFQEATVSVIDTATNTVNATINVGTGPRDVTFRPDGTTAYAVVSFSNTVSVIDTATSTVTATIPVGATPIGVVFSLDGTRAYVTNIDDNTVSIIDSDTNALIGTVAGFLLPGYPGVCGNGNALLKAGNTFRANNSGAIDCTMTGPGTGPVFTGGTMQIAGASVSSALPVLLAAQGGKIDTQANTATLSGVISGPGALTKIGAGTLILAGANSYSGATLVNQGPLQAGAPGAISPASAVSVAAGAALNLAGFDQTIGSLAGNGNVLLGAGSLTTGGDGTSTTFAGTISGSGGLTKNGGGVFTLAGANSYSGATLVNQGTLQAGAPETFSPASAVSVAAGAVLNLAGFDQTIGSLAGNGNVLLGAAALTTGGDGASTTFAGTISGNGGLTKNGGGVYTLAGANSYSGATLVNQGTLQAGAPGTFSSASAVTAAAGAVLDLAGFDQTIGSLAGNGNVLLGAAALTTGGDGTSTAYSGAISGAGSLTKNGGGVFTLTGVSNYSGSTTVAEGTLAVNGSISNSVVSVLSGAMLMGNGTLGGLSLAGTLAPGNSIGTLNVTGNATIGAGSIYEVEINPAGQSDLLAATGTVTLAGGQVVVLHAAGAYSAGTSYTIVTAGSGVTGAFDTVTDSLPLLDAVLSYLPTSVLLTLQDNAVPIASLGVTLNQRATGAGIDSLGGGVLEDALATLSSAETPVALDLLSGEIHASIKGSLIEDSRYLREAAMNRVRDALGAVGARPLPVLGYAEGDGSVPAPADTPLAAWGEVLGARGSFDNDGNAAELDRNIGGFLSGIDALIADNIRLGVIGGYSHSSFDVDDRASSGSANSGHVGAYGGAKFGPLGLRAGAAYSWHFVDTSRTAAFGSFAETLDADYDAGTAQVFGEAGYRIDTERAAFEPFANLAYINLHTDGFTETGGAAGLTHASDNTDQTVSTLGVRASMPIAFGGSDAKLSGMIGWRHAFSDVTPEATFVFAGGAPFLIAGTPIARNALALEAGFDMKLSERSSLAVGYSGQIGDGAQDHSANARLIVSF